MKKGIVCFMLTALIIMGIISTTSFAAVQSFKDVNSTHYSWKEIEYLIEDGVINGYPDGTFRPNTTVTRNQAITMLGRALNWDTSNVTDPGFIDVKKGTEGYRYLAVAVEKGIIDKNTTFNPNGTLTRAQMSKILTVAFELPTGTTKSFSDVNANHWAKEYIETLAYSNISIGYPDGTFKPESQVTRLQFSLFIARALNPEFREEKQESKVTGNIVKENSVIEYNNRLYTWCFDEYDVFAMCSFNLDGSDSQKVNLPEGRLAIWDDQFYMSTNDQRIISVNPDGTQLKTILKAEDIPVDMNNIAITDMNITDEWIYFAVLSDKQYEGYIYKVKHDGSSLTQVHNRPTMFLTVTENGLWLLEEYYEAWLTHIDHNGKKTSFDIHGDGFQIDGDWIYYVALDVSDFSLYRMKLDGTGKELIAKDVNPNSDFAIADSNLYYVKQSQGQRFLYKNSANGRMNKPFYLYLKTLI